MYDWGYCNILIKAIALTQWCKTKQAEPSNLYLYKSKKKKSGCREKSDMEKARKKVDPKWYFTLHASVRSSWVSHLTEDLTVTVFHFFGHG